MIGLADQCATNGRSDRTPNQSTGDPPEWHGRFLGMLPKILSHARRRMRNLPRHVRDEAVDDVVALALLSYARLVERGLEDRAYASPLAQYSVAQYRAGRRAAGRVSSRDVLANTCPGQRPKALPESFEPSTG